MDDCIFCKIIKGEIPCRKVYEDEAVLAFDDIHPMSPIHVVLIPKRHVPTLLDLAPSEDDLPRHLIQGVQAVARIKGLDRNGFRMVINCMEDGGQVVFHLHCHILGGQRLKDDLA